MERSRTPFWVNGDGDGTWINKFEYLENCGSKVLEVEYYSWDGGDDYPCDTAILPLEATCPATTPPCPDIQCPANSHPKAGLECIRNVSDCQCEVDYELSNGMCVERPPTPANCYLWTNGDLFYGWNADIPRGTFVEAMTSSGEQLRYTTQGAEKVYASDYHKYGSDSFSIRFVLANGVGGDWKQCINYFGTSTRQPVTDRCYLWSNRLYFGRYTFIPSGYKVEARTVVGKDFQYSATGQNYVTANDFRSYDSQPFHLRFVDSHGNAGAWRQCVNYTPIAIDVDRSGAVEHIEGTFVIDITADGNPETLSEWFAPTEAILIDTKHAITGGVVTGHHLFGDMGRTYVDGFEKLALLDENDDGVVSGDELDGLALWIDSNSNALLEEEEKFELKDFDIVSISVVHDHFISEAVLGDGSTLVVEDKWFVR